MDQIVLGVGVEPVAAGEVVEVRVDVLEIPGVDGRIVDQPDLGLGRDAPDVVAHGVRERRERFRMQQLEAADQQVVVLADRDAGPPVLPALRSTAAIDRGPEQSDDDDRPSLSHICLDKSYLII